MLNPHAAMPLVKLFKEVRVDLEQVQCGGVRERSGFHEAEKQEQIVELGGLAPQILLVTAKRRAVHEFTETIPEDGEVVRPTHAPIIARSVYIWMVPWVK